MAEFKPGDWVRIYYDSKNPWRVIEVGAGYPQYVVLEKPYPITYLDRDLVLVTEKEEAAAIKVLGDGFFA